MFPTKVRSLHSDSNSEDKISITLILKMLLNIVNLIEIKSIQAKKYLSKICLLTRFKYEYNISAT